MKNRKHKVIGWCLLITAIMFIAAISRGNPAAINDIQIIVSSDVCDGYLPNPQSFVVYAQNQNSSRPISATFQYDSNPSSQSFPLYDASLSPYTDRFPKSLVIRVAAGATVPIGCTYNYRASSAPKGFTSVPIVVTLTGAAYVNPSEPNPPPEDARAFSAFFLQVGYTACGPGSNPPGLFYLLNLHPYARLTATLTLLSPPAEVGKDVAPLSVARVGCSNGNGRAGGVVTAKLVYPPGQKKQP